VVAGFALLHSGVLPGFLAGGRVRASSRHRTVNYARLFCAVVSSNLTEESNKKAPQNVRRFHWLTTIEEVINNNTIKISQHTL